MAGAGLRETDLDDGYRSTGSTAIYPRFITRNLHLATPGGVELYSSDNPDRPIAREDFETEVGATLLWHF